MAVHSNVSPEEAADRLAIRELVDAYAYCADRRDAKGQMALFTPDTQCRVYGLEVGHANSRDVDAIRSLLYLTI